METNNNGNTYLVIGGLWFDKVNGNTYNNAKIIKISPSGDYETKYAGYCYGYGNYYLTSAKETIKETYNDNEPKIIDGGKFYLTKKEIKNNQF